MLFRLILPITLAAALAGCGTAVRDSYGRPANTQPSMAKPDEATPEWLKPRDYHAGGAIPEMEPRRKINEQACTTGVDPLAGNLRCK